VVLVKTYLMRAPILPGFGSYSYQSITLEKARELLGEGFISAIRYQWDADLLRDLLGFYVQINRGAVRLELGDRAVVFEFPEASTDETAGQDRDAKAPLCIGLLERTK